MTLKETLSIGIKILFILLLSSMLSGCYMLKTRQVLKKENPGVMLIRYNEAVLTEDYTIVLRYLVVNIEDKSTERASVEEWCASIPLEKVINTATETQIINGPKYKERDSSVNEFVRSLQQMNSTNRSIWNISNGNCLTHKHSKGARLSTNKLYHLSEISSFSSRKMSFFYSTRDNNDDLYFIYRGTANQDRYFVSSGQHRYSVSSDQDRYPIYINRDDHDTFFVSKLQHPVTMNTVFKKQKLLYLPFAVVLDIITAPYQFLLVRM